MHNIEIKKVDSTNKRKHGQLTAKIGDALSTNLQSKSYDVFYDHGVSGKNVGKIVSTIEKDFVRGDELSQLDIAIVKRGLDKKAIALIEIEETTDKPKTFLGDIFGVLIGNHILFGKNHDLLLTDEQTTLFIVGINNANHEKRNKHIREQAKKVKPTLTTGNSRVGDICIKTFMDEDELFTQLPAILDKVLEGK